MFSGLRLVLRAQIRQAKTDLLDESLYITSEIPSLLLASGSRRAHFVVAQLFAKLRPL